MHIVKVELNVDQFNHTQWFLSFATVSSPKEKQHYPADDKPLYLRDI